MIQLKKEEISLKTDYGLGNFDLLE